MLKSYLQLGHWSDIELIAAVESFNEAAYAELQERHAPAARTFAAQLSPDPSDVDAIVAGTFAQLHDVLRNAAGPKVALRPYLFTTVRWAAHDHLGSSRAGTSASAELRADTVEASADPQGSAPDRAGAALDAQGSAADTAGAAVDGQGLAADTAGEAADTAERAADAAGLAADMAGPAADAAGPAADAAQVPADAAGPSAATAKPTADPAELVTGAGELPEGRAEQSAGAAEQSAGATEPPVAAAEPRTGRPTSADDGGAAQLQAPDLGEPLFADPATARLVRSPLYRAFRSLPERLRAVLWHTDIELTHPGLTATILGLSLDGVEDLADAARDGLHQAWLQQHLSDVTQEECTAALTALSSGAGSPTSESSAVTAQQHLEGCADCRDAAAEIADLRESLQRVIAPVFLGAVAAAYLSAASASVTEASLAEADVAPAGLGVGGLRWTRQQPSSARRRARPPAVLVAGGAVLCVLALTGLALAAVSNTAAPQSPGGTGPHAAVAPAGPAAVVPPGSESPAPSPAPGSQTLVSPAPQATTPTPAPTAPVPTTPVPTTPAPTPTCPTPKHCRLKPCRCPTPPPPL